MAAIPGYEAGVRPQGQLNVQASGQQFGAQIGEGLQQLGGSLMQFSANIEAQRVQRDAQEIQSTAAQQRLQATKELDEWAAKVKPGDDASLKQYADKIMTNMDNAGFKPSSRSGKQMFEAAKNGLLNDMGQRAQARLSAITAAGAANDFKSIMDSLGQVANMDPSQHDAVQQQMGAFIDDPNGLMAKIPQPQREAYRKEAKEYLASAALSGKIQNTPDGAEQFLKGVAPDKLHMFDPFRELLENNAVQGGKVNLTPEAQAQAPTASAAGARHGVNPNVILAQAEAAGPVTPESVKQTAATMEGLLTRYGGDYEKALAAMHTGTKAVDEACTLAGSSWMSAIPAQVADKVSTITANAGQVQVDSVPAGTPVPAAVTSAAPAPQAPVDAGDAALRELPFEKQRQTVQMAVEVMNARVSAAYAALREAERLKGEAQDQQMDAFLKRIVDPKRNTSVAPQEILENTTIYWKQKQHMIDYMRARQNEAQASAENRTNPEELRKFMLRVHANEGDPKKIYNMDPIMESYAGGRLSTREMVFLRGEVTQMKDGANGGFMDQVKKARETAHSTYFSDFQAKIPGGGADAGAAWYNFTMDLEAKIQAKRDANQDPRVLLDPKSPEYVLTAERLRAQWPKSAQQQMANAAAGVKQQQGATPAQNFEVGKSYMIKGVMRKYKGGPVNMSTSWSQ